MLGSLIKELRKKHKLTQSELANKIGVTTSSIGMYETEVRQPSYGVLCKIAEVFDVSVDYLLGRTSSFKIAETKAEYKVDDLDPAYFKISKEAQEQGITADDLRLAIDFIKKSREKNERLRKNQK